MSFQNVNNSPFECRKEKNLADQKLGIKFYNNKAMATYSYNENNFIGT